MITVAVFGVEFQEQNSLNENLIHQLCKVSG